MATSDTARSARLNMRVSPEVLALLKAAAAEQHQDLSAFVLGAAVDRARSVLIEHHVLQLSPHAVTQLDRALNESSGVTSAEVFVRHLREVVAEAMPDPLLSHRAAEHAKMLRT